MSPKVNRREFVVTSAAGLAAAATTRTSAQAPAVIRSSVKPVVVSSANGHTYKNGGAKTGVEVAFGLITEGKDVLDALIAGVNLCELDPEDTSVGYGGLPNADGIVQLDASCMHGPSKRAGAVACIEGVRTPSLVAQKVLTDTDHHLHRRQGRAAVSRATWASRSRTTSTPIDRAPRGSNGSGGRIRRAISIRPSASWRCAASSAR